ncbi:unnamed protein product [Adineta steineri]|uniref:Uncharacterized protein n=2 Tax=Adineta steineri TaxID=433720 RepID=A0A814ARS2_9BILA|nr:unnamed protein product [Adineta steineri]
MTEKLKNTIQKYMKTLLLVLSWCMFGLCGEIIGPTMTILAHNIQVTFNGMATVLASASAGGLITNIICGIFQNFINNYSELMLTTAFFMSALLMSMIPFVNSLLLMCMVFFLQGVSGSLANMGGTNILITMWKTRVATPLNIVHLGYGFGAIFANLLVRPFLNNEQENFQLFNKNIRIPYIITGILCFVISIGHFICFIQKSLQGETQKDVQIDDIVIEKISLQCDKEKDKIKFSQYSPKTCGNGYFKYGLILSLLFLMYIFFVSGTDQVFAKFYFSFLKNDQFHISTNNASWAIILYWFSYSMGRLIFAILSIFLPVYICLTISWCGCLILAIIWNIYVWVFGLTITGLFILGGLTGLIIAPLFPLSFAWFTQNLNVITPLLAALLCACGLGSLVLQKIAVNTPSVVQTVYASKLTTNSSTYLLDCSSSSSYYEAIQVKVSRSGLYTFFSKSNLDTYGSIYKDYFNPSNPIKNRLNYDDNSCNQRQFGFTIALETSITYILVVTTNDYSKIGAFSIFVSGPNNVDLKYISSPSVIQIPYLSTRQSNYSSELTTNSQKYSRDGQKSNYYYQAIPMHVMVTGHYALSSSSNMDTFGYIYKDDFNSMNPFENLLSQDYRSCSYQDFKFITYLQTGTKYILVVTTSSPNITGKFSILTSGPNDIILNPYDISSTSTSTFTTAFTTTTKPSYACMNYHPTWILIMICSIINLMKKLI